MRGIPRPIVICLVVIAFGVGTLFGTGLTHASAPGSDIFQVPNHLVKQGSDLINSIRIPDVRPQSHITYTVPQWINHLAHE